MLLHKDNYVCSDENSYFEMALSSVIGDREEQQDSAGFEIRNDEGLIVVCDGMGGHEGGKIASSIAAEMLLTKYCTEYPVQDIKVMLESTIESIDERVSGLKRKDGTAMQSGSTIVAVVIQKHSLYWTSVGDSRIYLYRDGELVQATQDHIYQRILDEQIETGEITKDEYDELSSSQGEALVSFLGIGGLPQIEINDVPFDLQKDDIIVLATDGLYKAITDEEIGRILDNFSNINDALKALELKVQREKKNKNIQRDNMTVALIKVK